MILTLDKDSFANTQKWIAEIKDLKREDAIMCLVGNKSDLNEKRSVTKDEGELFAKERGFIFQEVSAKSGQNVNNLFYKDILDEIARKLNSGGEGVEENPENKGIINVYMIRWQETRFTEWRNERAKETVEML